MHMADAAGTPTLALFGPRRAALTGRAASEAGGAHDARASHESWSAPRVSTTARRMPDGTDPGRRGRRGRGAAAAAMSAKRLSALVVAHDEEARLPDCLAALAFADEIVVVLDRCTDGSREIAHARRAHRRGRLASRRPSGATPASTRAAASGSSRSTPTSACRRRSPPRSRVVASLRRRLALIPGRQLRRRRGWCATAGAQLRPVGLPGLFRSGAKSWGAQRVHPSRVDCRPRGRRR